MRNDSTSGSLSRTHGEQPGLPRGRSSLPADAVRSAQRDRLLRAMIAATAERGYTAVMIADVVQRARVSRKAFYTHFADKEACFLAANELGVEEMFARIAAARTPSPPETAPAPGGTQGPGRTPPPEGAAVARLRASLRAYLRFLADEPEFAHTFIVDCLAAGPESLRRFTAVHARFAGLTRAWHERSRREHPTWPPVPPDAFTAVVGAVHELVAAQVRAGRTERLPELEDTVLRVHLALLAGWPETVH